MAADWKSERVAKLKILISSNLQGAEGHTWCSGSIKACSLDKEKLATGGTKETENTHGGSMGTTGSVGLGREV